MKRILVYSALLLLLSSCSGTLASYIEVFNNSSTLIRLVIDGEEKQIKPRGFAKLREREFRQAVLANDGVRWNYGIPWTFEVDSAIPESFIVRRGWGSWQSRYAQVQIDSDNRVWLLGTDQSFPVRSFVEQPEGFPLIPH